MAYYLPSSSSTNGEQPDLGGSAGPEQSDMSELKIYWGPEICRLEYLLHLMETGRIVDEYQRVHA